VLYNWTYLLTCCIGFSQSSAWPLILDRWLFSCVTFSSHNKAIVDIRLHPPTLWLIIDSSNACNQTYAPVVCHCMDQPNSQFFHNSIHFLNLSAINAKLTSLSYVHVSKPTFTITIVITARVTCFLVILPINRPISLFFYTSLCK